jgi:hypothetical protein
MEGLTARQRQGQGDTLGMSVTGRLQYFRLNGANNVPTASERYVVLYI